MDNALLRIYLTQIAIECDNGMFAVDGIQKTLKEMSEFDIDAPIEDSPSTYLVFFHAKVLVNSAAGVSRMLWPPGPRRNGDKKRSKERGKALRDTLGVDDTHLLKTRTLRDHFEHFDERLDDWAENSVGRQMVTDNIGPIRIFCHFDPKDVIVHYDPEDGTLYFRGEKFSLPEISHAVIDIQERVDRAISALNKR